MRIRHSVIRSNREGSVLVITALGIFLILAVGGAGIDFGREQLIRNKMQIALDVAAGAAAALPTGTSTTDRGVAAISYFNSNYPASYLGVARPTPYTTFSSGMATVSATCPVDTLFMKFIGLETLTAQASSSVKGNGDSPVELMMVFDMSLPMASTNQYALNQALPGGWNPYPPNYPSSIGDAGYAQASDYRAGTILSTAFASCNDYFNWCNSSGVITPACATASCSTQGYPADGKEFFGIAGHTAVNALHAQAVSLAKTIYLHGASTVGLATYSGRPNNGQNGPQDNNYLWAPPQTQDFIMDKLSLMYAWGNRDTDQGLEFAMAGITGATDRSHVLVLTIAGPNTDPTRDGLTLNRCTELKSQGVLIYVITFMYGDEASLKASGYSSFLPSQCASGAAGSNMGSYYFTANDAGDLRTAFQHIAADATQLHISQ